MTASPIAADKLNGVCKSFQECGILSITALEGPKSAVIGLTDAWKPQALAGAQLDKQFEAFSSPGIAGFTSLEGKGDKFGFTQTANLDVGRVAANGDQFKVQSGGLHS